MIFAFEGQAPEIAEDCFIAHDANVIGRVRLGAGASIWYGATLRGDNEWIEIGAGSNVQENTVMHTDIGFPLTVGAGCTVGHTAILHGCTLEDYVLVGMGATVMNGARIGRESLIAAGALITEGKEIPPRSLVIGAPAKIVRTLDDAAVAGLHASAENYQAKAQRFRSSLVEVPR